MRNAVREAFNDVASKLPVQDIYGAGKSKMLAEVTQKCRDIFGKDGIVIDQLTINGALRLPQNVNDAINRAMEATQKAIQSENRVAQVEAEADAGHHAGARRGRGGPAARAGRGRRAAHQRAREAQANEIIRLSTTPTVLQYRAIEHWDGKLPQYNAGALPLLTFDVGKGGTGMEEGAREKRLKELLEQSKPSNAGAPAAEPPPASAGPDLPAAAQPRAVAGCSRESGRSRLALTGARTRGM